MSRPTDRSWMIETKVAGVTFEGRQEVVARVREGDWLPLLADPDNAYDPNAVGVWLPEQGGMRQVGYIPKVTAGTVAATIRDGFEVWGRVVACTGGEDESRSRGLVLHLRRCRAETAARG